MPMRVAGRHRGTEDDSPTLATTKQDVASLNKKLTWAEGRRDYVLALILRAASAGSDGNGNGTDFPVSAAL